MEVTRVLVDHASRMQDTDTAVPDLAHVFYDNTFKVSVDQKRRLQVPSKWRSPEGPEIELRLLSWVTRDHGENCILVLPPKPCADMAVKINSMPAADPKAESLRRWFGGQSARVTPDKSGRITIPEIIASKAGISADGDAYLVGLIDRFQIWSPERHVSRLEEDEAIRGAALDLL